MNISKYEWHYIKLTVLVQLYENNITLKLYNTQIWEILGVKLLIFISLKENNAKQGKIIVGFLSLLVGISICSLACFLLYISLTCIWIDFIPITFPKTLQTRVTFYILIICFFQIFPNSLVSLQDLTSTLPDIPVNILIITSMAVDSSTSKVIKKNLKSFNEYLTNSNNLIVWLRQTFQILLMP